MLRLRRVCKNSKIFVEQYIRIFCPDRHLIYNFEKEGYNYPARTNSILPLPNRVSVRFYRYFPDYNNWLFNYMLDREIYLTIEELNERRFRFAAHIFKEKPIKKLKL